MATQVKDVQPTVAAATPSEPLGLFRHHRILVGVDDQEPAHWACETATRLAAQFECDLALLHAVPWLPMEPESDWLNKVDSPALRAGNRFVNDWPVAMPADRKIERFVREGDAARQLVNEAALWHADLVVVGTHGRRGLKRMMLGSVASAVVKGAPCPVLCISRPPARTLGRRILVPMDYDEMSPWALEWASRLAGQTGGELMLFHSVIVPAPVDPVYGIVAGNMLDNMRLTARDFLEGHRPAVPESSRVTRSVALGTPGREITKIARDWRADLIVMGTHGRGMFTRCLLGGVTEHVLRHADCPVVCIRRDPDPVMCP